MREVVVMLGAFFVVPQLMKFVPNFDPLLAIVGLFGFLALLQHLGMAGQEAAAGDGDGPSARGRASGRGPRQNRNSGQDNGKAQEMTVDDLIKDAERCLEQNSWSAAAKSAQSAIDLEPESAKAWELLAQALKWDGKRDEAKAKVQQAMDFYELKSAGLKELAKELASSSGANVAQLQAKAEDSKAKRHYDLACECYTKAIEAYGDDVADAETDRWLNLLRGRAECAQQLQDWSMCRKDATKLLEADPNDARALLQRAASNEALEKFSAALEDARRLLAVDPKSVAGNRIVQNCRQALR